LHPPVLPHSSSFFFNHPATTDTSPLSLHDALPICRLVWRHIDRLHHRSENLLLRNEADLAPVYIDDGEVCSFIETIPAPEGNPRSEEHTSELQSRRDLVCRLLLEKKKKNNNKTKQT